MSVLLSSVSLLLSAAGATAARCLPPRRLVAGAHSTAEQKAAADSLLEDEL